METDVALVTGANKGIGKEIARQLAERGLTVLLGARDEGRGKAAAAELAGAGDVRYLPLDVADDASVRAAAAAVEAAHGRLDVLVNNAGISIGRAPAGEVAVERMRELYGVNVFGVVAVTNAMLPLLRRSAAPRVVNVSSELGSMALMAAKDNRPEFPYLLAYNSSKAALNAMTLVYARQLADDGIIVNAVSPPYTATDLNRHQGTATPADGARIAVRMATDPAGRTGTFLAADGTPLPW
ncbi:MAG: SDR family NAD(P)-dependent oxidoreductase [Mycobacteriales bacterium]